MPGPLSEGKRKPEARFPITLGPWHASLPCLRPTPIPSAAPTRCYGMHPYRIHTSLTGMASSRHTSSTSPKPLQQHTLSYHTR